MRIGRCINNDLWPTRVKINLFGEFHSWREYVSYLIIWNCAENKGYIFGVDFVRLISCLTTGLTWIWILPPSSAFFLTKLVVGTLSHFIYTLSILDRLCKNKPPNIRIIDKTKKRWVQNSSGGFFICCKINVYGLECYRCVCYELLGRFSLTFLQSGRSFTGLRIMFHQPCTFYTVNIRRYLG